MAKTTKKETNKNVVNEVENTMDKKVEFVLKKVQLRWRVENLKCEWHVLRKWVYFEANFKNRCAFLKVGQWSKVAQTHSTVRGTVATVTLKF